MGHFVLNLVVVEMGFWVLNQGCYCCGVLLYKGGFVIFLINMSVKTERDMGIFGN